MKKKILITFCAAMLLLAAACGKKTDTEHATLSPSVLPSGQTKLTAEDLLKTSEKKYKEAASVTAGASVFLTMDYQAGAAGGELKLSGEYAYEEAGPSGDVHMNGTISADLLGPARASEYYLVHDGNKAAAYERIDTVWLPKEEIKEEPASMTELLGLLRDKLRDCAMTEQEGIFTITGQLPMDSFGLFTRGMAASLGAEKWKIDVNVPVILRMTGDGTITFFQADLTEGYGEMTDTLAEDFGLDRVEVERLLLIIHEVNTGQAITITLPPEAGAAGELSAEDMPQAEALEGDTPPKKDEDGFFVLGNPWDDAEIRLSTPSGYSFYTQNEKEMYFCKKGSTKRDKVLLMYSVIQKDASYDEENISAITDISGANMGISQDYSNVTLTEDAEQKIVSGTKIYYKKLTWVYLGTIYGVEYDAWTTFPDGRMVRMVIKEESYGNPCDTIEFDQDIRQMFYAIEDDPEE